MLSTPDPLTSKGDTSTGPSFAGPCDSGAGLSLTHHLIHALRAPVAQVTVRDEGPESAHLRLQG